MCRLFGFRSIIPSQVHRSLVSAENALVWQSKKHSDGWGVAYFVGGYPHVIKSASTAMEDALFRRVSGIVASHTVLAHLRLATKGSNSLINSHPFQYGNWVFAHNGDISNFAARRGALHARIPPVQRRFILGDTDSEVIFYLLLGHLARKLGEAGIPLHQPNVPMEPVIEAVQATVAEVEGITGFECGTSTQEHERLLLSFVLTNGDLMLAHHGGKDLLYSTHKVCCPERDVCPSFSGSCEAAVGSGEVVNHLVISSEELHGENVWEPMSAGEIIGVDARMRLHHVPGRAPRLVTHAS
ncbi:MAG: class II glutamine amidotransferase [Myxococcota bacterium]